MPVASETNGEDTCLAGDVSKKSRYDSTLYLFTLCTHIYKRTRIFVWIYSNLHFISSNVSPVHAVEFSHVNIAGSKFEWLYSFRCWLLEIFLSHERAHVYYYTYVHTHDKYNMKFAFWCTLCIFWTFCKIYMLHANFRS